MMENTINILKIFYQKTILLIDGPMGTMIQKYQFSEEDFSGQLLKVSSARIKRKQ